MEIKRINTYDDSRFSETVLKQHGCFTADDKPYEVETISDFEAIVRGEDKTIYRDVIEEFRFYTPHITRFYDENMHIAAEYPAAHVVTVSLDKIRPSQFYVDEEKIAAVSTFIHKPDDIIIQAIPYGDGYISIDGHTRLYYAVMNGWTHVRAVTMPADENKYMLMFAAEAKKRGIYTPRDMALVGHAEYEEKWNRFCDDFFANIE